VTGTRAGVDLDAHLTETGIEVDAGTGARHCVDWTEQRHHLSGALGRRVATRLFDLGWLRRAERGRMVTVTAQGGEQLSARFGIDVAALDG